MQLLRLLADVGQDATIDVEHMAVDSIGGMRCEEDGGTTQL